MCSTQNDNDKTVIFFFIEQENKNRGKFDEKKFGTKTTHQVDERKTNAHEQKWTQDVS